jgi:hypothetical protein
VDISGSVKAVFEIVKFKGSINHVPCASFPVIQFILSKAAGKTPEGIQFLSKAIEVAGRVDQGDVRIANDILRTIPDPVGLAFVVGAEEAERQMAVVDKRPLAQEALAFDLKEICARRIPVQIPLNLFSPDALYFARYKGSLILIKIGKSRQMQRRFNTHAGNEIVIVAYVENAGALENAFHTIFKKVKATDKDGIPQGQREWFNTDMEPEEIIERYLESAIVLAGAELGLVTVGQDEQVQKKRKLEVEEKEVELEERRASVQIRLADAKQREAEVKIKESEVKIKENKAQLENEFYQVKLQMLKDGKITLEQFSSHK